MKIFIHTNKNNEISALIGKYTFDKHTNYETELVFLEDFKELLKCDGHKFFRKSRDYDCYWYKEMTQSFFPVRFLIPELINYKGKALIIDPDIFAVKPFNNIEKYLTDEKPIAACMNINNLPASSVMLLDKSKFKSWSTKSLIESMFIKNEDFDNWMYLKTLYSQNKVSILPKKYNEYDKIEDDTIILHTTKTYTQPWKTGLKYYNYELHNKKKKSNSIQKEFLKHPSEKVENFFFQMAKECYEKNIIDDPLINKSIKNKWIRKDFLKILKAYKLY